MEPVIHLLLIVIVVAVGMNALAEAEVRRLERLWRQGRTFTVDFDGAPTVTVHFTADTTQFAAALDRAADQLRRLGDAA